MVDRIFNRLIAKEGLKVKENRLNLFKSIDFSMYPANAFAITLQKLSIDKNKNYLRKLGFIMGNQAAKEMLNKIKKIRYFLDKDYQKLNEIILLSGFGEVSIDKKKKDFRVICEWHPVISKAKKLYAMKSNVCEFYGAVFASFIKEYNQIKNLKISHPKCVCKGDSVCEWIFQNG